MRVAESPGLVRPRGRQERGRENLPGTDRQASAPSVRACGLRLERIRAQLEGGPTPALHASEIWARASHQRDRIGSRSVWNVFGGTAIASPPSCPWPRAIKESVPSSARQEGYRGEGLQSRQIRGRRETQRPGSARPRQSDARAVQRLPNVGLPFKGSSPVVRTAGLHRLVRSARLRSTLHPDPPPAPREGDSGGGRPARGSGAAKRVASLRRAVRAARRAAVAEACRCR